MNDLKGIIEDCNKSDLVSDRVIKKVIEIIGQEEWQILHDENNDVCTTIGELIITLKEVAELEKENAELKESLKKWKDAIYADVENYDKQLTKAKELLKRLLITSCNSDVLNLLPNCSEVLKVRVEAEQFLNSGWRNDITRSIRSLFNLRFI